MKSTPGLLFFISFSAFAAADPSPRVIYGADDRQDLYQVTNSRDVALADSTVALIRAKNLLPNGDTYTIKADSFGRLFGLCETEPFFDQPSGAYCSGSLVAPDIVITAGHCIKTAVECASTKFVFNYAVTKPGVYPTTTPVGNVVGCKEIIAWKQENTGADFSVIRLEHAVVNHAPLKINRVADLKAGDQVGVIGHPGGMPVKLAFGDSAVRTVDPAGYFMANLDTYGGSSGSAVFNTTTGLVEGVLVRGDKDFIYSDDGCRVSKICPADGCRGEDVTKIAELAPFIPDGREPPPPTPNPPAPPRPGSSWPSLPIRSR